MRAGVVLEALAAKYRVSLLVVPAPQYQGFPRALPGALESACQDTRLVSYDGEASERIQRAGHVYRDHKFDVIHVFRLCSLPFARPYLTLTKGAAKHHLDLDDVESKTHKRIAALHRRAGNDPKASYHEVEARRLAMLEAVAFRSFDRIYVCSEVDREQVAARCSQSGGSNPEISVLRNVVRSPSIRPRRVFRILFIGTLGYYPNEDAIRFFCVQVLPMIRDQSECTVVVDIVGRDSEGLQDLKGNCINVIGEVPDVAPHYEACDAVIVPLRAGGGTRIKILEAFSYGKPVISTSLGIEGIEATPNYHVLVADTPEDFATACLQLAMDQDLGHYLTQNAANLLQELHNIEELKSVV